MRKFFLKFSVGSVQWFLFFLRLNMENLYGQIFPFGFIYNQCQFEVFWSNTFCMKNLGKHSKKHGKNTCFSNIFHAKSFGRKDFKFAIVVDQPKRQNLSDLFSDIWSKKKIGTTGPNRLKFLEKNLKFFLSYAENRMSIAAIVFFYNYLNVVG